MPANAVWVESATMDGQPCSVAVAPGPPSLNVVECNLENLFSDDPVFIDVNVVPRRTGSFNTAITVDAENNGRLHSGTDTVSTNVAQGVTRTLSVTAKARNGGDGSVNISPAASTPCTAPSGGNQTVQCFNFYDNNTSVTLTAKPGTGSSVVWEGACAGTAGNGPCTLTMSSDKSTTVRFVK